MSHTPRQDERRNGEATQDRDALYVHLPRKLAAWFRGRAARNHRKLRAELIAILEGVRHAERRGGRHGR